MPQHPLSLCMVDMSISINEKNAAVGLPHQCAFESLSLVCERRRMS